jgi:hypothetical protein
VIQQGAVSLWEEAGGKELLRDIRGPGDMIGIERFLGSQSYPYSAKSNDPILSQMYSARRLFDLRPAVGNADSWQHLERSVREAIRSEPAFQKLLANDCLSALPPLTFFQDEVVDESGERTRSSHWNITPLVPSCK